LHCPVHWGRQPECRTAVDGLSAGMAWLGIGLAGTN
jgi:hypothetical protein